MELEIIKKAVADVAGISYEELTETASFTDDLNIFASGVGAILLRLEAEFDVRFPDEAYVRADSVRDIHAILCRI